MKEDDFRNIDIEHLKILPEKLKGFEEFCNDCDNRRRITAIRMFKLFSKNNELGDFHDKPIYEFHDIPRDNKISLYQAVCNSFREFNAVLDGIVAGEIGEFQGNYKKSVIFSEMGNTPARWEGYQDFIDSGCNNLENEAFEFFERRAIGPNMAEHFFNACPDERIKTKNRNSSISTVHGYSKFNDPIPFVSEVNPWDVFKPSDRKDGYSALLSDADHSHERLRIKLRLASLCRSTALYFQYLESKTMGKDKEINYLKSVIYRERVEKHLMASEYLRALINENFSQYYPKYEKGKNNGRGAIRLEYYSYIAEIMENIRGSKSYEEFFHEFKKNKSYMAQIKVKPKLDRKIDSIKKIPSNDKCKKGIGVRAIIGHIEKYFEKMGSRVSLIP